jgi:hypothetical protein
LCAQVQRALSDNQPGEIEKEQLSDFLTDLRLEAKQLANTQAPHQIKQVGEGQGERS